MLEALKLLRWDYISKKAFSRQYTFYKIDLFTPLVLNDSTCRSRRDFDYVNVN